MRIAYFSPLPPQSSGIADYSAALLPYLARSAEIDLYVDSDRIEGEPPLAARFRCRDYRAFQAANDGQRYDAVLYHLGNNPQHAYIYRTLLAHPGVIVLHEYVLHHLMLYVTHAQGHSNEYVAALSEQYGEPGWRHGLQVVNEGKVPDYFHYPLSGRAIRASTGVIAHSRYLLERVRREHPDLPARHIPHFSFSLIPSEAPPPDGARARRRLGIRPDQVLIGSFGFIVPSKRIEAALRAFRQVVPSLPDARYLLVGEPAPEIDLPVLIRELGLEDRVIATGGVPEEDFLDYLAAIDICVNLRWPTGGESSGSLIRTLGLGKPAIVSRVGSFFELPDEVCLKISPGAREIPDLVRALLDLAGDEGRRRRMGAAALAWIEQRHRPEDAATAYLDFLRSVHGGNSSGSGVRGGLWCSLLADGLLSLGIDRLGDPALRDLARPAADFTHA